jgi:phosphoribosyl 1,2-cyclic phosphodiesterase
VKQRVMSRVGHLSNLVTAEYLSYDLESCTSRVVLGHISEQNNHPEIARMFAVEALERRGLETNLSLASQNSVSEVFQF